MNEPIRKISKNLLRVLVFLIFFGMFAVGTSHFFLKFPTSVQQPIIKIRRHLTGVSHKIKLSFPDLNNDEGKAKSLQALLSTNTEDVLIWCRKFKESKDSKLKDKVRQCLLQKESTENLLDFVKQILEEDGNRPLAAQYLNSLQINPSSTATLKWLIKENHIEKIGLVQIMGALLQRKEGQASDVEYLMSLIEDENEDSEVKSQAGLVLGSLKLTNQALLDFHSTKVKNNSGALGSSLHFLSVYDPQSLRDNFLIRYKEFNLVNRLALLKEVKILCPAVELDQWRDLFFQSNQYKEKEALMVALLQYQGRQRSDKIATFLDDLKLRPKEKGKISAIIKQGQPESCP